MDMGGGGGVNAPPLVRSGQNQTGTCCVEHNPQLVQAYLYSLNVTHHGNHGNRLKATSARMSKEVKEREERNMWQQPEPEGSSGGARVTTPPANSQKSSRAAANVSSPAFGLWKRKPGEKLARTGKVHQTRLTSLCLFQAAAAADIIKEGFLSHDSAERCSSEEGLKRYYSNIKGEDQRQSTM